MNQRRSSVKGAVTAHGNNSNIHNNHNNNITKNNVGDAHAESSRHHYNHTDFAVSNNLGMHHIMTLAFLLSKGAHRHYVEMTTTLLGRAIKKSQQSASRHLADLEQNGFIERGPAGSGRTMSVKVTMPGFKEIELLSSILSNSLNTTAGFEKKQIHGVLVSGMGEGAYYMALDGYTRQFRTVIGYVPFPGTLNIRLRGRSDKDLVRNLASARTERIIESFSDDVRTYGWVKCFPAVLYVDGNDDSSKERVEDVSGGDNNNTNSSDACIDSICVDNVGDSRNGLLCELIMLERTHHDESIVELVSPVCLRDAASISDGSNVIIEIHSDCSM